MGWKEHLKILGYDPTVPMSAKIDEWWGWYTATNDWYDYSASTSDGRTTYKVDRLSIKPARMVCQEWASLILNEQTQIATENDAANELVERWIKRTKFLTSAAGLVERAFALGTGAWALRVKGLVPNQSTSPNASFIPEAYDARSIVPLSYDSTECTECAFVSEIHIRGVALDQLQIHRIDVDGTYVIDNAFFNKRGERVAVEGMAESLRTGSAVPTFALVQPALENTYWDYGPFGVSVFDDAIGAAKLVDAAIDNMYRDIFLGQKMLFLDERMLARDSNGRVIVPRQQDQQLFRKTEVDAGNAMIEEYNPDLRVEDNRSALMTGLEMLGARAGMGPEYFSLEGASGVRTATEVNAEQSDLFRNVHKHENALAPAIATIVQAMLELTRNVRGESVPDYGEVTVTFDDSIIDDTATRRKRDMDDVAAGLMQPWEYRVKWYGEDESTARAMTTSGEPLPPEL